MDQNDFNLSEKKYFSIYVYRILKMNSNKIITDVVVVSPPFYTYRKNWTKEIRSVADSSWFSNRSKNKFELSSRPFFKILRFCKFHFQKNSHIKGTIQSEII